MNQAQQIVDSSMKSVSVSVILDEVGMVTIISIISYGSHPYMFTVVKPTAYTS